MSQPADPLSRRERQIMDIDLRARPGDRGRGRPPRCPTRRAIPPCARCCASSKQKGHLRHQQDGPRYVFLPTVSRDRARRSAMRNLVRTFFDGSSAQAAAALIDQGRLSDDEFDRLAAAIEKARKEGR